MAETPSVLVVDDDAGIRETMLDILTLEGYTVEVASEGGEALQCYRRRRYDVVLLDIRMPGMNGVEVLRALKQIDPAARVIMITGYEVGDLAVQAMQEGAEAVFRKPLDVATFLPVLLTSEDLLHSDD
jgi:DNA-binding NtrC family response regulator